jgi:hypothetical protein
MDRPPDQATLDAHSDATAIEGMKPIMLAPPAAPAHSERHVRAIPVALKRHQCVAAPLAPEIVRAVTVTL